MDTTNYAGKNQDPAVERVAREESCKIVHRSGLTCIPACNWLAPAITICSPEESPAVTGTPASRGAPVDIARRVTWLDSGSKTQTASPLSDVGISAEAGTRRYSVADRLISTKALAAIPGKMFQLAGVCMIKVTS